MKRALRLLLAAALLVAWQQALVHPLAHVDAGGALVHLADAHDSHGRDHEDKPDPLCDAIAAVAAAIGAGKTALEVPAYGAEALLDRQSASSAGALQLAYRSQAPPQHS